MFVGKHLVENGDFIPARTDNRELELQDRNARTTASNSMKLKIIRTIDNQCPRRDKYIVLALVTTPKHRLFAISTTWAFQATRMHGRLSKLASK